MTPFAYLHMTIFIVEKNYVQINIYSYPHCRQTLKLRNPLQSGDIDKLTTVPGIGQKSASRLVLELKDKVVKLHPGLAPVSDTPRQGQDATFDDALSALVNLGYRSQDAREALKHVKKSNAEPIALKDMIRESLKELARG